MCGQHALFGMTARSQPSADHPNLRNRPKVPSCTCRRAYRFQRVARQLACEDCTMEVLSSRILLRPADLDRSRRFSRDVLGLAVYREFGLADDPAVVFFLGQGLLGVSRHAPGPRESSVMIWLQVRDVRRARPPGRGRGRGPRRARAGAGAMGPGGDVDRADAKRPVMGSPEWSRLRLPQVCHQSLAAGTASPAAKFCLMAAARFVTGIDG